MTRELACNDKRLPFTKVKVIVDRIVLYINKRTVNNSVLASNRSSIMVAVHRCSKLWIGIRDDKPMHGTRLNAQQVTYAGRIYPDVFPGSSCSVTIKFPDKSTPSGSGR